MEHKFHTYEEAHDAGYRGVKGNCRDVTPPADGYGYRFENDDGERTVTVWFSEEKTTMGAVGVYRPMFLPRVAAAAALLGRKGGSARSEAKAAAARENGRKGGRPVKMYHVKIKGIATAAISLTAKQAIAEAERIAPQYPGLVYICWFRARDQQHGYLNWDGHDVVGHPW